MATGLLGTSASILGVSLVPGAAESGATTHLSAETVLTFTQTVSGIYLLDATSTVAFTDDTAVNVNGFKILEGESSIAFTQDASGGGARSFAAENTIAFTGSANNLQIYEVEAESSVAWQMSTLAGALTVDAETNLAFDQFAHAVNVKASAINIDETTTVTFTDDADVVYIKVSAIDVDAETTLTFELYAGIPVELEASSSVNFTQSSDNPFIWIGNSTVSWTQSAVANMVRNRTVEQSVSFNQAIGLDGLTDTKRFSVGGSVSLTKPTLSRQSSVRFYTLPGAATEVVLPNPEFGNRDRLALLRINRESRGGDLTVFLDDHWPTTRSLVMEFTSIKAETRDAILSFLEDTIGQEVGFDDWEGRSWTGVITNPDAECVENSRGRFDISIDFEGELA